MNQEKYEYVWKNYRHLLEASTCYSQYLRAALFPINSNWPDAKEVSELKASFRVEELTAKFQEIEREKNKYISAVYGSIVNQIFYNYCPRCNELAISPKSERCVKCKHEWYGTNAHRQNS